MSITASPLARRGRPWAALMSALGALFLLRVGGQLVQFALPQPWLPAFTRWQGSGLPYPLLLAMQVIVLGALACAAHGAWSGTLETSPRREHLCLVLGSIYLALASARIAIGLWMPRAPAWFGAWIPASFHVVLAGFVLALAGYHASRRGATGASR